MLTSPTLIKVLELFFVRLETCESFNKSFLLIIELFDGERFEIKKKGWIDWLEITFSNPILASSPHVSSTTADKQPESPLLSFLVGYVFLPPNSSPHVNKVFVKPTLFVFFITHEGPVCSFGIGSGVRVWIQRTIVKLEWLLMLKSIVLIWGNSFSCCNNMLFKNNSLRHCDWFVTGLMVNWWSNMIELCDKFGGYVLFTPDTMLRIKSFELYWIFGYFTFNNCTELYKNKMCLNKELI